MKREIAFFDFDGTITTKDTLLEFIKFSSGKWRFYWGFLLNSPYLVAYKLKLISNQAAKEKILKYFFRKMPLERFQQVCHLFAKEKIPALIRPGSLETIQDLQKNGVHVIIVSASPENWIREWSNTIGVQLIATRLVVKDDLLTGNILGRNCHGDEKVQRIKAEFDLSNYETIYAYGDTNGDKPMLSLATHSYYKPFR